MSELDDPEDDLQKAILKEVSERKAADTALDDKIDATKAALEAADVNLQANIDAKQDLLTAITNITVGPECPCEW